MGTQGNQILTIFLLPRCGIPDRMFYNFGVALYCLLGACPVFVAGTGCEISSPYIDKPGILTPIFRSASSVHVRNVQQLLPVLFRSVPECSGFSRIPIRNLLSNGVYLMGEKVIWLDIVRVCGEFSQAVGE